MVKLLVVEVESILFSKLCETCFPAVISNATGARGGDLSQWLYYCIPTSTTPGKGTETLVNLDALIFDLC